MSNYRREEAKRVRASAAQQAYDRIHPEHLNNGDEQKFATANYAMSFTKGLDHNDQTGLVDNKLHFEAFRSAIDNGFIDAFTRQVPVPRVNTVNKDEKKKPDRRLWEAPTAGTAYDLEGPDAQAVTMLPAPELCSDELAFEMAEVYELALLRDVPFSTFVANGGPQAGVLDASLDRLNNLDYAQDGFYSRPRTTDAAGMLTRQTAFRGSSPEVEKGPYLSSFMLMGTRLADQAITSKNDVERGEFAYGAQCISQQVITAKPKKDYMQKWDDWLFVQQGFQPGPGDLSNQKRFIFTPRDLATYVHFDALYQAYLNAALILLAQGASVDPGFARLAGSDEFFDMNQGFNGVKPNAGGFALYGGPHILTLVTEVATRALKAVRYQKFNNHIRLRPEALAARIERHNKIDKLHPSTCGAFTKLRDQLCPTVEAIEKFNAKSSAKCKTALLPMAFSEGSPMHPAYGAGHATVAGACVTILKAFFDTSAQLGVKAGGNLKGSHGFYTDIKAGSAFYVESINNGCDLHVCKTDCPLTLEGELNKLAANISIGRNMAGVHYFSDYYDSLRMGEEIAIGILEEQALTYSTDPFVLSVPTFDGDVIRIGHR